MALPFPKTATRLLASLVLSLSIPAAAAPVELSGQLTDPPSHLNELLGLSRHTLAEQVRIARTLATCDEPLGPRGGTRDQRRERRLLDDLGYCVRKTTLRAKVLKIELGRYNVVRKVYLSGNWPLFEEDLLRRLRFRAGQRLPPPGPARDAATLRAMDRLKRYLARHGYPKSRVDIRFSVSGKEGHVTAHVKLHKGMSYRVGKVEVLPMGRQEQRKRRLANWEPALGRKTITGVFRDRLLFLRRAFTTKRFKEQVESLIKRYHRKGYAGVRIKADYRIDPKLPASQAVRITIRIQERKRIDVQFSGNSALSSSELKKMLTIYEAGAYDDYELHQSALAIAKRHQTEGYLQARVRFTRTSLATGAAPADRVTFWIDEGPRFRVKKVRFAGNKQISTDKLRKQIKTVPYPFWGFGEGGYVTQTQIEQDVDRLTKYYKKNGFPRVKVEGEVAPHPALLGNPAALAATVTARRAEQGRAFVRFSIEEGPRFRVAHAQLVGVKPALKKSLNKALTLRKGGPFTEALLKHDTARIIRFYAERGHPYARVQRFDDQDEENTDVGLHLVVDEAKQAKFGQVFLRGNFMTRPFVILSALAFKPGQPFDIRKREQSEKALRKLGIFNSVRVQLLDLPNQPETIHVLIQVDERFTGHGTIAVGFGGSTDNPFFGSFGYTWGNLWGFGARLEVKGEAGPEIQSANVNIHYPNTLGSFLATDLRFYVRNELTERLGDIFTYGASLALSRDLFARTRAIIRYDIRQIETEKPLNRPAGSVDEGSTRPVRTRTGSFSSSIAYDARDNLIAPTRGVLLETTLRWASGYLGGTDDFLTLRLHGQVFVPLPLGITIALGARYDHGLPLGGAVLLPAAERFFAGGDTTIRGFEEDRAFAETIQSPFPPLGGGSFVRVTPQGGNIRLLTNAEIQFPIYKAGLLGLPLYGALFADNGFVTNSLERFRSREFRHSMGAALRLKTPVGFLSFELAFPLDRELGDPAYRLHFNFGFIL